MTGMVFITKTPQLLLQIGVIGGMPWLEVRRAGGSPTRRAPSQRPAAHLPPPPAARTRARSMP